jgi:hypothetical protein
MQLHFCNIRTTSVSYIHFMFFFLKKKHKIGYGKTHIPVSLIETVEGKNLWLGITFRQSKTFVLFNNELPYFSSTNKVLTLANENQRKEFFKCRSLENSNIEYVYPEINYTISIGDMLQIKSK